MPRTPTTKPADDRMQTFYAARANEEKRMDALAKRIQKAAASVSLAATYHGDGAYQSAALHMRRAAETMELAQKYIRNKGWQAPGGPK
jgi:hypothetical protein